MKVAPLRIAFAVALGLAASSLTGCSRKSTEAPPTTTPVPPVTTRDTTTTPTQTTPPESGTPRVSSSDFQPAFFDFDSYALRDDARTALDRDAKLLRDNPDVNVTIEGHCDERGTPEYNQALGERRAQAAKEYLVAAGIGAARLETVSYGKERPFSEGHDESAWAQNRRAHFVVR